MAEESHLRKSRGGVVDDSSEDTLKASVYEAYDMHNRQHVDKHVYLRSLQITLRRLGSNNNWELVKGSILTRGPIDQPRQSELNKPLTLAIRALIKDDKHSQKAKPLDAKLAAELDAFLAIKP